MLCSTTIPLHQSLYTFQLGKGVFKPEHIQTLHDTLGFCERHPIVFAHQTVVFRHQKRQFGEQTL